MITCQMKWDVSPVDFSKKGKEWVEVEPRTQEKSPLEQFHRAL
jgi:hypothetical protein